MKKAKKTKVSVRVKRLWAKADKQGSLRSFAKSHDGDKLSEEWFFNKAENKTHR